MKIFNIDVLWALPVLMAGSAAAQSLPVTPLPTNPDRILSEADTYHNATWYCHEVNMINDTGTWPETICPYTVPGWQRGVAYKAGGYQYLDTFLDGILAGMGAGDKRTPSEDPRCVGLSCAGFLTVASESNYQLTSSFKNISSVIASTELRMGDLTIWPDHHGRIFVRRLGNTEMIVYECTTSVVPARVVMRSRFIDNNFNCYRLRALHRDPEPIIQFFTHDDNPNTSNTYFMPFDAQGSLGHRVETSEDGDTWQQVLSESTLNHRSFRATITAPNNRALFVRMVSVDESGNVTAPSNVAAIRASNPNAPRVLIVDGLDSWRHRDGGEQPSHEFIVPIAQTLDRLGYAFESTINEMVATNQVDLRNYAAVIWLTGEDAVKDEGISRGEQFHIRRYLENGGKLLLSGSNIAWDLSHQATASHPGVTVVGPVSASEELRFWDRTDDPFLTNYLRLAFASDAPTSVPPEFTTAGVIGTPLENLTVRFDDGTNGTYDVRLPDSFTALDNARPWLTYPDGRAAAVGYEGGFGGGTLFGCIVTMGFPLETVWNSDERDALLAQTLTYFDALPTTGSPPPPPPIPPVPTPPAEDTTPPTVALIANSKVVSGPFDVTFTFSEPVTGFALNDLIGTNVASVGNLRVISPSKYTVQITPAAPGTVRGHVRAGAAVDAAGNPSLQSTNGSVTYSP